MLIAPAPASRRPLVRDRQTILNIAFVSFVAIVLITQAGVIENDAEKPTMWIMAILGALAGTQAFIGLRSVPAPVICPTICFTFAILQCWGLGPAIIAQTFAVAVVAWRLHRTIGEGIVALAQYTFAFLAAALVLWWGHPHPLRAQGTEEVADAALTIIGAVVVWIVAYGIAEIALARLNGVSLRVLAETGTLRDTILFKAALVTLSPILAVAAHINIGLVPLVFIPLYAVQRMAALAGQRDRAARMDPLTGLANRAGLKLTFTAMTNPPADRDRRIALLLADLDEFKQVNDALGHEIGDQLLCAVADRLRTVGAPRADVARLGGDEFAVVVPVYDHQAALDVASDLVAALRLPIKLDGLEVGVAASIGVAMHTPGDDFATLMRHADIAMYDAKQRGDDIALYEPAAHQDTKQRLALLTDLRRALEDRDSGEISMYYQPQVSLETGRVEGVEALLRWCHPDLGPVSTQDVISLAERSAVMHTLTFRVIDEVVAQAGRWAKQGLDLRVSLNVSSRDLYGEDIVRRLADQLRINRVDPSSIQIEITEGALLRDPGRVSASVGAMRALGVSIALDDFGTGYSSLQHLRRLPISEIKIDRSFVGAMAHNHDDAAIVRSTVDMARALGLRTVAEGVETEYTRRMLADAGCTLAQGWLTAHPMPAADLTDWLTENEPEAVAEPA